MGLLWFAALVVHVAALAIPPLGGAAWISFRAVKDRRGAGFWALAAAVAVLLAAARLVAVVLPYRGQENVGVWAAHLHLYFNLPLVAAGAVVAALAVIALPARFGRPGPALAALLGSLGSFPLYSVAAIGWPSELFAVVGVRLAY